MATSRAQTTLADQQDALKLLGARLDGTFGDPLYNAEARRPWSAALVAEKLKVSRPAVFKWKARATSIMSVNTSTPAARKIKRIKNGHFIELEVALSVYMRSRMVYIRGSSLFRAEIVGTTAKIAGRLISRWTTELALLDHEKDQDKVDKINDKIKQHKNFKASSGWVYSFLKRNHFHSVKGGDKEGFVDHSRLVTECFRLKHALCTYDLSCVSNTDEVALLYRALPRRSIRDANNPASYDLIKDRLTALFTVYADGRKAPLTVIGTAGRPRSFLRHFDAARDLGIFYKSQKNAWNTQYLWTQIVGGFNKHSQQQCRKIANIIDNCSAHSISYNEFEYIETIYLPPNMTSVLQPVDATVGRSFKCAFRRLLIEHILHAVEKEIEKNAADRRPFKMNEVVTTYSAVVLMKQAWDLLPASVVLKGWMKTDILATHQSEQIGEILNKVGEENFPAEKPFEQSCFESERKARELLATKAKEAGQKWLQDLVDDAVNESTTVVDDNFAETNIQEIRENVRHLASLDVIEEFSAKDLEDFYDREMATPVCRPVDEECAVDGAVEEALDTLDDENRCDFPSSAVLADNANKVRHVQNDGCSDEERGSGKRFEAAVYLLRKEAGLLVRDGHSMADAIHEQLGFVLDQQVHSVTKFKKRIQRQTQIENFLTVESNH